MAKLCLTAMFVTYKKLNWATVEGIRVIVEGIWKIKKRSTFKASAKVNFISVLQCNYNVLKQTLGPLFHGM